MELGSHEKFSFNSKQKTKSNIDNKFNLDNNLDSKFKIDENEKKLLDFCNSKLEAMEKINLNDEFFVEEEIKTKLTNLDKNVFSKSEHSKSRKNSNSPKKSKIKKNNSRKKPENKNNNKYNNKNMIINHDGKIEKTKMESKDLIDFIVNKEIKEKEMFKFLSDQTLLNSIINEMKDE